MHATQNPYTEQTRQSRVDQLEKHAHLVKRVVTRMAARLPPGVDQVPGQTELSDRIGSFFRDQSFWGIGSDPNGSNHP